jgi:hypothetical protein
MCKFLEILKSRVKREKILEYYRIICEPIWNSRPNLITFLIYSHL